MVKNKFDNKGILLTKNKDGKITKHYYKINKPPYKISKKFKCSNCKGSLKILSTNEWYFCEKCDKQYYIDKLKKLSLNKILR